MSLNLVPMVLDEANAFVAKVHRHHRPVRGAKFCIGAAANGCVVGVAIVGRPSSRHLDDTMTLEVTRVATDGDAQRMLVPVWRCMAGSARIGFRQAGHVHACR